MDRSSMLKKIILSAAFFTLPWIVGAEQIRLSDEAPKTYVVEEGDTLWDISSIFLDQPWLWPQLWRLNPEIDNPHLIYPGDVLRLVYDENGEPQLVVEEPEMVAEVVEEPVVEPEPWVKPSLKLSPQVRKSMKRNPIPTLPLKVIAPYIQYDSLLSQEQVDSSPYIVGSDRGHKSSLDGFKVYVTDDLELGTSYAIYHKGEQIIDPETQELLGYNVKLAGTAQAVRNGDIANKRPGTLLVNSASREIRSGNIVLPINQGQLLPSFFTMRAADKDLRGVIVKSSSDGREFGKLEVVMINRGKEHNVKPGDMMVISRKSPGVVETITGPRYTEDASRWERMSAEEGSAYNMPEEPLGQVMVFRVYDKAAMALILKTEKPSRLMDIVTSPNAE